MIDYFSIQCAVSLKEALQAKDKLGLVKKSRSEAVTNKYKSYGVSSFGIWINLDEILDDSLATSCTLTATIDATSFYNEGHLDVSKIITTIDEITASADIKDAYWTIQFMVFKVSVDTDNPLQYIQFLNSGYSLKSLSVVRTMDDLKQHQRIEYKSSSIRFIAEALPDKNLLQLECRLYTRKLKDLKQSKSSPVNSRKLTDYVDIIDKLETMTWSFYLNRIAGTGDYYSYKEAEKLIESCDKSRTLKDNMEALLKGVAVYKSVEKYIEHVEDENPQYDFMKNIHNVGTAKSYIKMLEKDLGINPVTISRRDAKELKIGMYKNILNMLDIKVYKAGRKKKKPDISVADVSDIVGIEESVVTDKVSNNSYSLDMPPF